MACAIILSFAAVGAVTIFAPRAVAETVSKSCGKCGKAVSVSAKVGDVCPHCGVRWGLENESTVPAAPSLAPALRPIPLLPYLPTVPTVSGRSGVSPQPPASAGSHPMVFSATALPYKSFRNRAGMLMIWIPPSTFRMGSPDGLPDERAVRQVTFANGFWLGNSEVTQGQWLALMGGNPSKFQGDENLPVEQVGWEDAVAFCKKLTANERATGSLPPGFEYGLPSEAQWEYACRAGTEGDHAGDLNSMAWYGENSGGRTHPVNGKAPNPWGLHDMHGNVWERCADWYGPYPASAETDPLGPANGSKRVDRGGGWRDAANLCRSATRNKNAPGTQDDDLGLRVALVSAWQPASPTGMTRGDDLSEAISAGKNLAEATFNTGLRHLCGDGIPRDNARALRCFQEAARQGYAPAEYALGHCLFTGQGASQDVAQAVEWFQRAANHGSADAQYSLGYCYANGCGVTKDPKSAYRWLILADAAGNKDARACLTPFEASLSEGDRHEAQAWALRWRSGASKPKP